MERKLNIVLLIPSLKRGGAERVVSRLSFLLQEEFNIEVVVFNGDSPDYEVSSNIHNLNEAGSNYYGMIRKSFNSLRRVVKYIEFKRKNEIDITYSFGNTANFVNILSGGEDKKIVSIRGYGNLKINNKSFMSRVIKKIVSHSLNKADKVVSVSELIKHTLINKWNVDTSKINVIYNGIDTEEIHRKTVDFTNSDYIFECIADLKSDNSFIYTSMGSYRKEKGYDILLQAFLKIHTQNPATKLLIIGNGDELSTRKMKQTIESLNLSDSVILTGFQKNPYQLLSLCDCYVLSSRSEGFPNALVEAMAVGLPIVATNCPSGPKEILSSETESKELLNQNFILTTYGILTSTLNSEESNIENVVSGLYGGMKEMFENPVLRNEYSQKAILRSQNYSYDKWIDNHRQLFADVLKK